jgi:CheY-like chemotaxis protein
MSPRKVLIIDNDPGIADAFKLIFSRAGYDMKVLNSPRSVLAGSEPSPDLYIIDKQLSGVDGLDVCRFLKAQALTRHLPVIITSATPLAARLATDACADAFVEKPFRRNELLQLVQQLTASQPEMPGICDAVPA